VQPPLVSKRNPKDLGPESVSGHHGIGLLCLSGVERPEGITAIAILKQRVLYRSTMDRSEERCTEYTSHPHHVERVQGPVVETLEE
jgi:hypothetical protein